MTGAPRRMSVMAAVKVGDIGEVRRSVAAGAAVEQARQEMTDGQVR